MHKRHILFCTAACAALVTLAGAPVRGESIAPPAPRNTTATLASSAVDEDAALSVLRNAEYQELQTTDQYARLKASALANRSYLEQHHQEILKNNLDVQTAQVARLDELRRQLLEQSEYLKKHDAELYKQALDWNQQQADQQDRMYQQSQRRANRIRTLRTGLESLPKDKRGAYLRLHANELNELNIPPPSYSNNTGIVPLPELPAP